MITINTSSADVGEITVGMKIISEVLYLIKILDGFEYVGLYGEYQEVLIPIPKNQEVKYRLLPPEEGYSPC